MWKLGGVGAGVLRWDMTSVFLMLPCRPKDWYRLDIVLRACSIESGL